jgi:hypothetical protein
MSPDELAKGLAQPGRASIRYLDRCNPDRPLVLECFRPKTHTPDKPIVIVQHGASRNGAEYSEAWIPAAERHGLLIVAITFSKEASPDAVTTTTVTCSQTTAASGRASTGRWRSRAESLHCCASEHHTARPDVSMGSFRRRTIRSSAVLATQPHGMFEAVGAANSGWYTLPTTLDLAYPDGLGGVGLTRDDVVRFLGYPLVIFSGNQDIDRTAENFLRHESAMAQGRNRFARAQFCIDRGRAEAANLGGPCRGSRVVVPGVAHEACGCRPLPAIIGSAARADAAPRGMPR